MTAAMTNIDAVENAPASHPGMGERLQLLWILGVLSLLMGFASISTDLYLPALSIMARELGAGRGALEFTVSGYLAGFALGQLAWGLIGDRFGRRIPTAAGIALFCIGSAGCALSQSIGPLIAWRVVQAIGASAGVVLARAMVRDLYSGNRAAQMLSTLIAVMALAPLLGPIVGGQILTIGSWHAIFWVLSSVGAATFLAIFSLPETLPREARSQEHFIVAFARYRTLIVHPAMLGYGGAGAFFYAGMFAYVAGSPFAYIDYYHVSPQLYGVLFAMGVIGIMAANIANARLVTRLGALTLMRLSV